MALIERLWGAALWPIGQPDVFGAMFETDCLYVRRQEAIRVIEDQVIKMGLLPIFWSQVDEKLLIGRTHVPGKENKAFAILVRSARLPPELREMPA